MPHPAPPPDLNEKVKIRNNTRRGLLVKMPGQALHLQPGASADVPRVFLATGELAALLRAGTVLEIPPPATAARPLPASPAPPVPSEPAAHGAQRPHKRPTR